MKNSLKKCLILIGAGIIIALFACALNSKVGFYIVCGALAIIGYIYLAYKYLKDAKDAQKEIEQLRAERIAAENAGIAKVNRLITERDSAEKLLAAERAKVKELEAKQPKPQSKAKK